MKENVIGIKGEYRELTPKEIGDFVRSMRRLRDIKRLVLAQEAGVSEKSLERLENGIRVSADAYRKVAVAVGQKEHAFLGPRYIPTSEEALKKAMENLEKLNAEREKWDGQNVLIDASPFGNERDVRQVLNCWGAMLVNYSDVEGRAVDLAAAFTQSLVDWGDIASEIGESGRLDACRSLLAEVQEIEREGYVARFGTYNAEFPIGNGRTDHNHARSRNKVLGPKRLEKHCLQEDGSAEADQRVRLEGGEIVSRLGAGRGRRHREQLAAPAIARTESPKLLVGFRTREVRSLPGFSSPRGRAAPRASRRGRPAVS